MRLSFLSVAHRPYSGRSVLAQAALLARVLVGCWALGGGGAPREAAAQEDSGATAVFPAVEEGVPQPWLHEHWTTHDGLPVNHATGLHQTPDGYLWIATFDGLVRFDGVAFTVFNASNTPALPSSRIARLHSRPDGSFWASTEPGSLVHVSEGRFDVFPVKPGVLMGAYVDGDSLTWLATHDGVFRYRQGALDRPFGASIGRSYTMRRDEGGAMWVATAEKGTVRIVEGKPVPAVPPEGLGLIEDYWIPKEVCPDGSTWHVMRNEVSQGERLVLTLDSDATDLLCDAEGSVWITTRNDGLHRVRRPLVRSLSVEEGLGFQNLYHIYQDRRGALWFGGGIYDVTMVSRLHQGAFRHYLPAVHAEPDDHAVGDQAIYEDRAGNLWLGFQVCPAEARQGGRVCERFSWAEGAPRRTGVYATLQTQDGSLWFGTLTGLFRLKDGTWTELTSTAGLGDDRVRYLLEARDGTLYGALLRGGVLRYRDGRFDTLTEADGLPSNHVRALYEDENGTLWIGTEDLGLARYDPKTGAITTFGEAEGLYYEGIHQVLEDGDGRLWMSTNRGLFWVWRSELEAVARGEQDRVYATVYTERDGMRNREANGGRQQAALVADDGRLWFATQDGAVVVDPDDVARQAALPAPVIERVVVAGRTVEAGRYDVALTADQRSFQVTYTVPTFIAPERVRFRYRLEGFDGEWVEAGGRREAVYTKVPPGEYVFRVEASPDEIAWTPSAQPLTLSLTPRVYETLGARALLGLLALLLLGATYQHQTRRLYRRQRRLDRQVAERTQELEREKRKTEEQSERLREMDRLKSRFFTNVSHEFRTPLTLTIGPLEDLQDYLDTSRGGRRLPPVVSERVELALRNSRRLLRLIGQLLDIAKLEAGELHLNARRADLGAFVQDVARSFVPLAERRRVRFTVKVPEEEVPVAFDADKMEQVVLNLLSNAFKFTPEEEEIHVAVHRAQHGGGTEATITVRDSGPGIPFHVQSHLFERFYQAQETYSEVQAGTGIGLSLAKDLVELHGGGIVVESTPGLGSAFVVRLPQDGVAEEHPVEAGPSAKAEKTGTEEAPTGASFSRPDWSVEHTEKVEAIPLSNGQATEHPTLCEDRTTVLIADDNDEIRTYVRSHLEPRFHVLEAPDGRQALEVARTALPDLILSDVMMPHLDGFELVQALRADRETDFLPVILLTARATEEDLILGLGHGADGYLTKPFSVRELLSRVDNLIESRRRLRDRFSEQVASKSGGGRGGSSSSVASEGMASDAAYVAELRAVAMAHLSDEEFGIEALAETLEQNRSTLYRRLRDALGRTPTAFLRELRLEQAAELLRGHRGTVSEVAYAVGFKSVSHFSQSFRAVYGVTPSAYTDREQASDDPVA